MRELNGTRNGTLTIDGNRSGETARITGDREGLAMLVAFIAEVLAHGEPVDGTDAAGKHTLHVAITPTPRAGSGPDRPGG